MKQSESNMIPTHEGWCTKLGQVFKTWKRRWFVLQGSTISYYTSPEGKLKGTISLKDSKVQLDKESKKPFAFTIITPSRTYYIVTNSEEETSSWINVIKIANGEKITKVGLEDFEILKVLGRGSLGKVLLVRHIKTKKLYALKSLSKAKLEKINLVFQTLIEKNALIAAHHPFLVSAKYTFQTSTKVFMALDYVPGGELMKQLEDEGVKNYHIEKEKDDYYEYSFSEKESILRSSSDDSLTADHNNNNNNCHNISIDKCRPIQEYDNQNYGGFVLKRARLYAAEIAMAIRYLHSIGFIHRDLKPSNILFDSDGYIKLTDFGFVKEKMFDSFAKTSTFCGTPLYSAPEIVLGNKYGRSVDWWSFGILVYEMIFYDTPFYSENIDSLYRKIAYDDFSYPPNFTIEGQNILNQEKKEIPFVLIDFLTKLLQKNPHQRLGSYNEDEIFNHPFFEGIEWNDLLNKKIQMDWKPNLKDENDVSFFYDHFTSEKPLVSIDDPFYVAKETNEAFSNFTFVDNDSILVPNT